MTNEYTEIAKSLTKRFDHLKGKPEKMEKCIKASIMKWMDYDKPNEKKVEEAAKLAVKNFMVNQRLSENPTCW
ncbi:MAG: hypothetical protein OXC46_10800 [Thaumarchaeota archaeon]|nr:hypothetical protein [Nitrososphaerota archaeon]